MLVIYGVGLALNAITTHVCTAEVQIMHQNKNCSSWKHERPLYVSTIGIADVIGLNIVEICPAES